MHIQSVGILSPGDMGHAIGAVLHRHGLRIITNLQNRSPRTANLAKAAGFLILEDDDKLVNEADIVLSIVPPSQAQTCAERIATALRRTGKPLLFVDCNAISPRTAQRLDHLITQAGGSFVDGGIIGGPPYSGIRGPRLYVSGTQASEIAQLQAYDLDVRVISSQSGQASGLKMCYASLTKGVIALATEALVAGRTLGIENTLLTEFADLPFFQSFERSVPSMPPKASRWVGEMEEISQTFSDLGLPPQIHVGAAALYRWIEGTPLGTEIPEQRQRGQSMDEVIEILATALKEKEPEN
jgi:3-hydroxyisobutyrate dehydrogenase-like beta-hydroxyacid dehydrogenase